MPIGCSELGHGTYDALPFDTIARMRIRKSPMTLNPNACKVLVSGCSITLPAHRSLRHSSIISFVRSSGRSGRRNAPGSLTYPPNVFRLNAFEYSTSMFGAVLTSAVRKAGV
jgi:hypothetical protein